MLPPSLFLTYACVLATLAFPVSIFIIADIVPLSVFTATALGSPSPSQWVSCALYTIPNSPVYECQDCSSYIHNNVVVCTM